MLCCNFFEKEEDSSQVVEKDKEEIDEVDECGELFYENLKYQNIFLQKILNVHQIKINLYLSITHNIAYYYNHPYKYKNCLNNFIVKSYCYIYKPTLHTTISKIKTKDSNFHILESYFDDFIFEKENIYIAKHKTEKSIISDNKKDLVNLSKKDYFIQKMIPNPYLVNGKKISVKMYALMYFVKGQFLKCYVYNNGVVNFAELSFEKLSTNAKIQHTQNLDDNITTIFDLINFDSKINNTLNNLKTSISILCMGLLANLKKDEQLICFQLYEVDCLIDENYNGYVNAFKFIDQHQIIKNKKLISMYEQMYYELVVKMSIIDDELCNNYNNFELIAVKDKAQNRSKHDVNIKVHKNFPFISQQNKMLIDIVNKNPIHKYVYFRDLHGYKKTTDLSVEEYCKNHDNCVSAYFQYSGFFCNKDLLYLHLKKKYGDNNIMPKSYVINKLTDMDKFEKEFTLEKLYILKKNVQRREGLYISRNYNEIMKIKEDYIVIQEIIENLYLYNERVFNLRLYVFVKYNSSNNSISCYLYNDGRIIVSDYIHKNDSNYYNKVSGSFGNLFLNVFKNNEKVMEMFNTKITDIFKKIFIGEQDYLVQNKKLKNHDAFELFGADVIFTKDYVPYLCEINAGPDLGEYHDDMVYEMIQEMFGKMNIIKGYKKNNFIQVL